ncbi:DUF2231 domain-containing protein [Aerosakkonemataceae cyanobacterium BLCC-F154]|uniref:DUF2231 domain-containing protein n=1 Tax=Floridaenema fluviatile BLCC-F154 TaxID=3153640 RepID=A0ABV4YBU6_9CYAN
MTQTPNLPPLIESHQSDYQDTGVTSTVAIAGHPLHPVIVTLPIAFLVAVPVCDLVYLFTKDLFWARGSFWLIAAGILTGLLAAATGLMDFFGIRKVRSHSAGWAHMILNIVALTLTIVNLGLRWGNFAGSIVPTGLVISIIVALLLGLSGWYGGELVYRHKIAVIGYGDRNQS